MTGTYSFTVNQAFDYTIAPEKTNDNDCGVTSLDAATVTQHTNGNDLYDYPYQVVAADMNLNRTVTAFDGVGITQLVARNE